MIPRYRHDSKGTARRAVPLPSGSSPRGFVGDPAFSLCKIWAPAKIMPE